jgi:hypothetical protein
VAVTREKQVRRIDTFILAKFCDWIRIDRQKFGKLFER